MTSETLNLIVGWAGLVVTLLAFVASFVFFLSGLRLQREATSALAQVRYQVATMHDKTLDAALRQPVSVEQSFQALSGQIEALQSTLDVTLREVPKAGHEEEATERLRQAVSADLAAIREQLRETRSVALEASDWPSKEALIASVKIVSILLDGDLTPEELQEKVESVAGGFRPLHAPSHFFYRLLGRMLDREMVSIGPEGRVQLLPSGRSLAMMLPRYKDQTAPRRES